MTTSNCIPLLFPGLAIVETAVIETQLCISVQSTEPSAACTKCGAVSKRVHNGSGMVGKASDYRDAINEALPEAVQVADRWHLLKNMVKAIQRYFSRHRKSGRRLVVEAVEAGKFRSADVNVSEKYRRNYQGPGRDSLHKARQEEREALFAAVKARRAEGVYTTDIAQEFDLSRQTVSKWVNSESLPPDGRGRFKRKCLIDDYVPYLRQRIADGCTDKSQLWREIKEQGFTGSRTIVGKWVRQNYSTNRQTLEVFLYVGFGKNKMARPATTAHAKSTSGRECTTVTKNPNRKWFGINLSNCHE